jgi:hypothetical protein
MRCILGPKKVAKLSKQTGLEIEYALCRGNTGHRIDLHLKDGTDVSLSTNGDLWTFDWSSGKTKPYTKKEMQS